MGDAVLVHGLQSKEGRKHNGTLGVVKEELEEGRYTVDVRDVADPSNAAKSTALRIKPGNLQAASKAAASHQPPPRPSDKGGGGGAAGGGGGGRGGRGGKAMEAVENMMTAAAEETARQMRNEQVADALQQSDADRIADARAALAATTDTALNERNPEGDGDQSFAREALESDPGRRLKVSQFGRQADS